MLFLCNFISESMIYWWLERKSEQQTNSAVRGGAVPANPQEAWLPPKLPPRVLHLGNVRFEFCGFAIQPIQLCTDHLGKSLPKYLEQDTILATNMANVEIVVYCGLLTFQKGNSLALQSINQSINKINQFLTFQKGNPLALSTPKPTITTEWVRGLKFFIWTRKRQFEKKEWPFSSDWCFIGFQYAAFKIMELPKTSLNLCLDTTSVGCFLRGSSKC